MDISLRLADIAASPPSLAGIVPAALIVGAALVCALAAGSPAAAPRRRGRWAAAPSVLSRHSRRGRGPAAPRLTPAVPGHAEREVSQWSCQLPAQVRGPDRAYRWGQRCFDVVFSAAALALSAPLMGLLAAIIKGTSRGPALFRQRRVGLDGREFTIYKLRTMIHDAERDTGPCLADPYDARVTAVGRWLRITRLDELPQFYNVLRGEMSVIGPRPERPEFTARFIRRVPLYAERLSVRPGITGLAQVRGGYDTDVYTKLMHDLEYVHRRSVWLDAGILLKTVQVVLSCAGR